MAAAIEDCELAIPLCRSKRCRGGVRRRAERRHRRGGAVERKVRTLKKLIPNCEAIGVERLFRETAEYIVALQRRVKVMQTVVDALAPADSDEE